MTKAAIITDLHLGARKENPFIYENMKKFYLDVFFPVLEKLGIKTIINCGDTLDRRKVVDLNLLQIAKRDFLSKFDEYESLFLIGNHDTYFKNTIEINCIDSSFKEFTNIKPISKPTTISIHGVDVCLIPWITQENYSDCMKEMKKTKARYCFGHFDIQGFEMRSGTYSKHGLESGIFSNFEHVFSGHYHKKSNQKNITYLGSPYQTTWDEYAETKGFHIFDLKTGELEFIENPYRMFYLLQYPNDFDDIKKLDLTNKFVKIVVSDIDSRTPNFQTNYDALKPIASKLSLKITDKILESYNPLDDKTELSEFHNVEKIGHDYIDVLEYDRKDELKKLFSELYNRAKDIAENQNT